MQISSSEISPAIPVQWKWVKFWNIFPESVSGSFWIIHRSSCKQFSVRSFLLFTVFSINYWQWGLWIIRSNWNIGSTEWYCCWISINVREGDLKTLAKPSPILHWGSTFFFTREGVHKLKVWTTAWSEDKSEGCQMVNRIETLNNELWTC